MAQATQYTKPFYAYVGAADLAVEYVRKAATDVQSQIEDVRKRDPKAFLDTLEARFTGLQADAKAFPKQAEARYKGIQADAKTYPAKAQARLDELQAELKALPKRVEKLVAELQVEY